MPNRVGAPIHGIRPSAAVRTGTQTANREGPTAHRNARSTASQQTDRVDISQQARARVDQTRPRGGAAQAPSAQQPQPGQQGAVNGSTAQRAEELRNQEALRAQETAQRPPARQGNLVDVVG